MTQISDIIMLLFKKICILDGGNCEQAQSGVIHVISLCCTHTTDGSPSCCLWSLLANWRGLLCGTSASTSCVPATRMPGSGTASSPAVSSRAAASGCWSPPVPRREAGWAGVSPGSNLCAQLAHPAPAGTRLELYSWAKRFSNLWNKSTKTKIMVHNVRVKTSEN